MDRDATRSLPAPLRPLADQDFTQPAPMPRRRHNRPLLIGAVIVLFMLVLAMAGPLLAPTDPLATVAVIRMGDTWLKPPYAPLTVPGFPLGSDLYGRDLLSRLLWGVRPTMIMVLLVGLIRLFLGTWIGLGAGWAGGWLGRSLETLISAALAVPVLIAALAAIAAIGIDRGLLPFVVGLSLTGWADTARLVAEQTRALKGQPFVEASIALGASSADTLLRHIVRQITPMAGMLFALEVGGTLMITAALGFLGYYVGGDFWVQVGDFMAARISGMPELGQMLATSWSLFRPWPTVAVGSVIVLAVLGFNLLGEGLRRQLSLARTGRRPAYEMAIERAGNWLGNRLGLPAGTLPTDSVSGLRLIRYAALLLIVVVAGTVWWRAQAQAFSQEPMVALHVPGNQLWATERRDPFGTLDAPSEGLANPHVVWMLPDSGGFPGGPAVAADGTVYVASGSETLYALDPAGVVRWQAPLPTVPSGSPALGAGGEIYIADKAGGLAAYTAAGDYLWRVQSEARGSATASPIVGSSGTIYYALGNAVQAVSPQGQSLWATVAFEGYVDKPPVLSPAEDLVYLRNVAIRTGDGLIVELASMPEDAHFKNPAYLVGMDGRLYLRYGHDVNQMRLTATGGEIVRTVTWNHNSATMELPEDAGVTRDQTVWYLYSSGYADLRLIFVRMAGDVLATLHYPQRDSRMIGIDAAGGYYVCGNRGAGTIECATFRLGSDEPLWAIPLEHGTRVTGGALLAGRLYVTTEDGYLYALDGTQQ